MNFNCLVILGPTASGKTRVACKLAYHLDGEIISADSRQVYKHLDIGTGKDLKEYQVEKKSIPYHLINVAEPQEQFYLHDFVNELEKSFQYITSKNKLPVIVGGTGLYLDALQKDFSLTQISEDPKLRETLAALSKEELITRLHKYSNELVGHVDTNSVKRITRGIEVAEYLLKSPQVIRKKILPYKPYYIGIRIGTEERKQNISRRLKARFEEGLVNEVKNLIETGLSHAILQRLGLEYKFISLYLQGKLNEEELYTQLETAIFQFSKRQMTWFRKMEKEGVSIKWIDVNENIDPLVKELSLIFPRHSQ